MVKLAQIGARTAEVGQSWPPYFDRLGKAALVGQRQALLGPPRLHQVYVGQSEDNTAGPMSEQPRQVHRGHARAFGALHRPVLAMQAGLHEAGVQRHENRIPKFRVLRCVPHLFVGTHERQSRLEIFANLCSTSRPRDAIIWGCCRGRQDRTYISEICSAEWIRAIVPRGDTDDCLHRRQSQAESEAQALLGEAPNSRIQKAKSGRGSVAAPKPPLSSRARRGVLRRGALQRRGDAALKAPKADGPGPKRVSTIRCPIGSLRRCFLWQPELPRGELQRRMRGGLRRTSTGPHPSLGQVAVPAPPRTPRSLRLGSRRRPQRVKSSCFNWKHRSAPRMHRNS